ncbi:MAG: hypothetical protein JWO48_2134 [Bryobacterales bacterium]|nr:hypothetical protein [Bryobacterales bacterium]
MLKKIGIPLLTLAAMVILVPAPKANAEVRFGISVGRPGYSYPVDPYAYSSPYPNGYYSYPAYPSYQAPVYGYSYNNRRGHEYNNEYQEHRRRDSRGREWREQGRRDHDDHGRYGR